MHTILAALREWQRAGCSSLNAEINEIADNGGECVPLSELEIDQLCEQINCYASDPALEELIDTLDQLRRHLEDRTSERVRNSLVDLLIRKAKTLQSRYLPHLAKLKRNRGKEETSRSAG